MKTIKNGLLLAILLLSTSIVAYAQQVHKTEKNGRYKYLVTTQLKETTGTYEQRKLFREFLTQAIETCPYVSNFRVTEQANGADNHSVTWTYEVNGWNDITYFYNWINHEVFSLQNSVLKLALTPYGPNYAIGGEIDMNKKDKSLLAAKKKRMKNGNDS